MAKKLEGLKKTDPDLKTFGRALKNSYGLFFIIQDRLIELNHPMTKRQIQGLLKRVAEYKELYDEEKSRTDERVEAALLDNAISNNNVTAQIFYMKAKCGWIEKQEITNNNIQVPIILDDLNQPKPAEIDRGKEVLGFAAYDDNNKCQDE